MWNTPDGNASATASDGRLFLETTLRLLVDHPAEVRVTEVKGNQSTLLETVVARDDVRRVIGRGGRTANALHTLLEAIGGRERRLYLYSLQDPRARLEVVSSLPAEDENALQTTD